MANSPTNEFLELVSLQESAISFSRLFANSVRYHHWHQCLEMLYVEVGYGVIIVDNQQYTMRPGRLFIFPPFKLHKVMVEDSQSEIYRRTIIHLDNKAVAAYLRDFPQHKAQLQRLSHRDSPAYVYDLSDIHHVIDPVFTHYGQIFSSGLYSLENIACLILNLLTFLPESNANHEVADDRLSGKVMQWIEEHYAEKFSLDALAEHLNLSKSYISRRFHQETGEMIHDYLLTYRIRYACELLRKNEMAIHDIARAVGFSVSTYFISSFKNTMGKTPLKYRKEHQVIVSSAG
ncbi:AraC family transcriptional regulator [Edaphovirga cremea]|uniref:AraC family transcriptional regulator n=1 Tax=Edaphovirga cremea TaxID=2267246 RepID=UPI000DEED008|nr:AraC family transcriptional regulator [Edaphovirga cremea]